MITVGVAIGIPEPWGSQIQRYRTELGDFMAEGIPTHITLLGPSTLPKASLDDIRAHLESVGRSREPFRVRLSGTDSFRPVSPVVFLVVADGAAECDALSTTVRTGPLDLESAFPYHPHVTVAHELSDDQLDRACADLADFECEFVAESFQLFAFDETDGWSPIDEFALTATAGTPR